MKFNKQFVTTAVVTFALLLFIGWRFVQYLGASDEQASYGDAVPQKAVMEQAAELNAARLDELAQQGKIAIGMSMAQVKIALGEPVRTYIDSSSAQIGSVWWYEHNRDKRKIYFTKEETVVKIE